MDTKTGAVICRKPIAGTLQIEYEALLYIKGIPHNMNDASLFELIKDKINQLDMHGCAGVIVRSDINATANEVWEQYNNLNGDSGKGMVITFTELAGT